MPRFRQSPRFKNDIFSSLCPNASSTSAQPASSSSAQAIVDSTTSEHNISIDKTKKPRKKRNESMTAAQNQEKAGKNANYDEMSAIDKLIGWFDPNVPERRDAAKVKCAVCNEEIVYDFSEFLKSLNSNLVFILQFSEKDT